MSPWLAFSRMVVEALRTAASDAWCTVPVAGAQVLVDVSSATGWCSVEVAGLKFRTIDDSTLARLFAAMDSGTPWESDSADSGDESCPSWTCSVHGRDGAVQALCHVLDRASTDFGWEMADALTRETHCTVQEHQEEVQVLLSRKLSPGVPHTNYQVCFVVHKMADMQSQ